MEEQELIDEQEESQIVVAPNQELVSVDKQMDPMQYAHHLAKLAEAAPLIKTATETIMFTKTYPADWKGFGDKMALSSAGAERLATMFPIKVFNVHSEGREDFSDDIGKGYRYVYRCDASMHEQQISATGTYSTRDKFLGYTAGNYRAIEDINENDIQQAAYRRCVGNAIKAILGIRNMPTAEWQRIMRSTGQDSGGGEPVPYNEGSQGGSTAPQRRTEGKESETRQKLRELIWRLIQAGCGLTPAGKFVTVVTDDAIAMMEPADAAAEILSIATCFKNKEGEDVYQKDLNKLKGKWLNTTKAKIEKAIEKHGNIPDIQ